MNVWLAFSNKRIHRCFRLFLFSPLRIINVQVTGTYKSSLYMYTYIHMYTYKLLIHIGFEIYLEQNHKTTANTPDMTWSYLSPLPHTCCISYEEACSLTTRQYSHMLLALKYKSTTSSVKISFLFVYSAWPLSIYFVLSIYYLDIYLYVTFHKNLLKLNIIPIVCMIVNILNWFLCPFVYLL